MKSEDTLPDGIKLTPQEEKAVTSVRKIFDDFKQGFDKVGIKTLENSKYTTHMLPHEELDVAHRLRGWDYLTDDLSFKHRALMSKTWMPDITEVMNEYIPRASRKIAFQPFFKKWTPFMESLRNQPEVANYFVDWIEPYLKGKQSRYHEYGNSIVNGINSLEICI